MGVKRAKENVHEMLVLQFLKALSRSSQFSAFVGYVQGSTIIVKPAVDRGTVGRKPSKVLKTHLRNKLVL